MIVFDIKEPDKQLNLEGGVSFVTQSIKEFSKIESTKQLKTQSNRQQLLIN